MCCSPCLFGMHPVAPAEVEVVEQANIVALAGYWAPPSNGSTVFYKCMTATACLPGANGTRSVCAAGYDGVVCSSCASKHFEQFGR